MKIDAISDATRVIRHRWLPLALVALTAITVASGYQSVAAARHHNLEVATVGVRQVFEAIVLVRGWAASHGGFYVPVDERTPPNPYLKHLRRDIHDEHGRLLTLVNPAYMTRQIAELADQREALRIHITSLNPLRPENMADAWESDALRQFADRTRSEVVSVEDFQGRRSLRYMAPLVVEKPCLACHAQQGYVLGDIRGGISIATDYAPVEAAMHSDIVNIVVTHLMFLLISASLSIGLLEIIRRRWIALNTTIAMLQETRDELVKSEKIASLGRLVAGFAHELNTPMGVALSAVTHGQQAIEKLGRLLGREEVHEAELREPIEAINESHRLALANLRRGSDMVMRFKRTSIDRNTEEVRRFQIAELINDVLISLHSTLKHLPIDVKVACPPELAVVSVPGLLEQVLVNLIMNSIHHGFDDGSRSGRIDIVVEPDAKSEVLHIHYADDGVGIAPAVINSMFEPFVTTRRGKGGSGLGLYIVYNIVTMDLGGTVRCDSAPGQGAHFYIDVPLRASPSKRTDPSEGRQTEEG